MQFIKPCHIQRLLKLKTPEDIREWRDERKANFPTKAKREASNALRRESNNRFAGERNQFNRENGPRLGEQRNSKFNRNGKFGRNNRQFNNGRHPGNKRPFDQGRQQQGAGEPNSKEAKLTGESNEQDNAAQNESDKSTVDSNGLEPVGSVNGGQVGPVDDSVSPVKDGQVGPVNNGEASQPTNPSTSRDNRTNHSNQQNRFKRRRQPTLLEKVSVCL